MNCEKYLERPGKYIYSYDYKLDESWLPEEAAQFSQEMIQHKLKLRLDDFMSRKDVNEEISKTAYSIHKALADDNKIAFTVLSDTHYVLNGNWEYTYSTIRKVYEQVAKLYGIDLEDIDDVLSGVIHLGDFTDGILSKEVCREYSHRVIDDLLDLHLPAFFAIGNHDANYFKKNPEIMDEEEQYDMYLQKSHEVNLEWGIVTSISDASKICYRSDIVDKNLTIISLGSYDNAETNRYGFSEEQIEWVKQQLIEIDDNRRILLISHDAPLTHLDYWAKEIRNGELLCSMLDEWNIGHGRRIIAFLHGHTHADLVCQDRSFPIISIGCSKIEYFEDKKPDGAVTAARFEDEVDQELWDTFVIDVNTGDIELIRFGAGFDRHVNGKIGKSGREYLPRPLVWAHRGACGYAPENTLEAFKLAIEQGADGIELDVQFTKDHQIVVIHDEMIDRTSDGTGLVSSFTLEELRQFNYNKTHPEYAHCDIPLLSEVLELVQPTEITINIELKTGIVFYPGIEREVMRLVKEYDMVERVVYSSFNHESVLKIKDIDDSAKCGFLYSNGIKNGVEYAGKYGVDSMHPNLYCMRYPGFVDACKEKEMDINVWTVNSDSDLEKMRQYGVNAIISNFPDSAIRLYSK